MLNFGCWEDRELPWNQDIEYYNTGILAKKEYWLIVAKPISEMDEIRRLKKDQTSSSKPNHPPVSGNKSASSSDTKGSGKKTAPLLNI